MPIQVLLLVVGVGMQQCMIQNHKYLYGCKYAAYNKQFLAIFPDNIFFLTFHWLLVKSLTAVKFPDISRFSRKVVTAGRVHTYASRIKKLEATKQSAMKSHKPQCHRCVLKPL